MSLGETWTCHVCGRERPDSRISVASGMIQMAGGVMMQRNVRYCNDRPECQERAMEMCKEPFS